MLRGFYKINIGNLTILLSTMIGIDFITAGLLWPKLFIIFMIIFFALIVVQIVNLMILIRIKY